MHGVTPGFANTLIYLTFAPLIGAIGYLGVLLFTEPIPPNAVVGFRTRRTRAEPHFWYAANKAAGGYILAAASISVALLVVMGMTGTASWDAAGLALMIPLGIAVLLSLVWHERH